MKNSEIQHYPDLKIFVMKVGDDFAKIEYTEKGNCYYLTHSEVPKHLRGKGIGKELVEKTFEYLHQNNIKGIAVCSYIKAIAIKSNKLHMLA
jgi:predicted GNAT family acetyltransferase